MPLGSAGCGGVLGKVVEPPSVAMNAIAGQIEPEPDSFDLKL
jgi:hypothetical protein